MEAAAGTSRPVRNPRDSPFWYGSDQMLEWSSALRSVKIRLTRMVGGSQGRVVYEITETLSDNPSGGGYFQVCLEGRVTGLSEGIPDTLITDSLAAAMAGHGRWENRKSPPGEADLHPSFLHDGGHGRSPDPADAAGCHTWCLGFEADQLPCVDVETRHLSLPRLPGRVETD